MYLFIFDNEILGPYLYKRQQDLLKKILTRRNSTNNDQYNFKCKKYKTQIFVHHSHILGPHSHSVLKREK